ncbi:hypothetical protein THAOC_29994 [Thalassiosira oceanica]|uniref:SET domain-containing protein n=1 Tax=Thalassiosira oceanica TaxID=159749 RepID=K0RF52_THAOC|nr:hypothetical protein THAOC_29994 [Thalassiosira oceanica]|eukprot:EJK50894.1 hypothetical protein THAOC_29994 [Thalassiosira oceanica]
MSPAWKKAVHWIESNGGHIHASLRYDDEERQVFLGLTSSGTPPIEKDTVLMTIPDVCLVSLHSVERDDSSPFGMSLFRVIHFLETMSRQSGESPPIKSPSDPSVGYRVGKTLYNNSQDVILALYLSHLKEISGGNSGNGECHFFGPYLATLPADSKFLPRQWPEESLSRRLFGTSLYRRAIEEREGVRREYELVKKSWLSSNLGTEGNFPRFELYDGMLGCLTSRAFASLGFDGVDAMIPLLDLLNHARGHGCNGGENMVRYERYEKNGSEASSVPMVKRQKIPGGGVQVRTSKPVSEGSALNMTYGAKSNATLLGRYGFCIDDNIEPDGSCNDVLEFEVKPGEPRVKLQRGPKSYCYGPLIEALEMCTTSRQERGHESSDVEDESDGLDAFLNGCEEDGFGDSDGESDEQDCFYAGTMESDDLAVVKSTDSGVEREIAALQILESKLLEAKSILSKNPLSGICDKEGAMSDEDWYCSILVRSELHTLTFYSGLCKAVLRRMRKEEFRSIGDIDSRHIENTADVFLAIRHGSM